MHNQLLKHCLLFVLSSIFYFGAYSQIGYKQWRNDIISEVNEEQQNVIHCLPRSLNGCNYINNNTFLPNSLYQSSNILHYHDPFNFDPEMIPEWYASHGTPNIFDGVNYPSPLPFTDAGYARMGAWGDDFSDDLLSEGVVQKIPVLTANKEYVLSFFKKIENIAPGAGNTIDNFNIVLMNCADYSQIYTPLYEAPQLPANSQVIYCERLVRNVNWEQVVIKFTANQAYDMIWVFPKQNIGASSVPSVILFSFPELIDPTNFSAGIPPATGNCHVTIGPAPLNCSVRNAVFTWRDPSNNIVYQGPNQHLNLDMGTAPSGTYTLSMSVPSAANITTNGCSLHFPVYSATVNVPAPSCNCTGLQIINPTFDYEWDALPPMSLSACSTNKLCNVSLNGDDIFHFTGMSNQANGNIWQIRKYNGPLYPNSNGIEINGIVIDYPASETFTTYSTNVSGDFDLFTMVGNDCNFEIKLINTITNTSQIIYVNIVMQGGVISQGNFFCVSSGTSICPIPHKLIAGYNQPGYSYQWTLPTGMNPCSSLTNAWITWDDANFDYNDPNHPPLVASLAVTNIFGCPSTVLNINIDPSVCNMMRQNNSIVEKKAVKEIDSPLMESGNSVIIFPNPAKESFRINTNELSRAVVIQAPDGRTLITRTNVKPKEEIFITGLRAGLYLVTIYKIDGKRSVYKLIKQ